MTQTQLQRHPGRGAIWGLILGLGIAVYLTFVWPVIGLDDYKAVAVKWALVVGGVMLLSILWGLFGPARRPKGAAPVHAQSSGWVTYDQAPPAPDDEAPPAPDDLPPPPPEG
jgi:type VI protein secretion system component VasK